MDVIHSSYYIHGLWVDEINFCRFICVSNNGPYTCYKTEVFNIYICIFSTIFYAISISDTCLRSRKFISKPIVDKISQSTAEMNYFRFRKTDGRYTGFPSSGFYFDVCVVIGVSFYICFPNFVEIGRSAAELQRHIDFSIWRHTVGNVHPSSGLVTASV